MATYTGFHIECYITVILKKKLLPSPATQEPLLADSAWPCQPPGFSGLMFSFFKSLLLISCVLVLTAPQNPISLYFIKKSISAICLPLVSGSLYPKIHECTQIIKAIYYKSGSQTKKEDSEASLRPESSLCLSCCTRRDTVPRALWGPFHADVNYATTFSFVSSKLITHNYNYTVTEGKQNWLPQKDL